MDWEAELAVVIGGTGPAAPTRTRPSRAIAGFTVLNDVTMRDWQYRTTQWLQGKTFEATTPIGPVLVTPDELPGGVRPALQSPSTVDGETVQKADTSDLVFDPVALVRVHLRRSSPCGPVTSSPPARRAASATPASHRVTWPTGSAVTEIGGIGRLENAGPGEP